MQTPMEPQPFALEATPVTDGEVLAKWDDLVADLRSESEILAQCRSDQWPHRGGCGHIQHRESPGARIGDGLDEGGFGAEKVDESREGHPERLPAGSDSARGSRANARTGMFRPADLGQRRTQSSASRSYSQIHPGVSR